MAFTASLRKILYGLLAAMCLTVMFLYWNQTITKPSGGGVFGEYEKPNKLKLVVTPQTEM